MESAWEAIQIFVMLGRGTVLTLRVRAVGGRTPIVSGLESSALQVQVRMRARLAVQVVLREILLVVYGCIGKAVQRISTKVVLVEVGVEVCWQVRVVLGVEELRIRHFHGCFHSTKETSGRR